MRCPRCRSGELRAHTADQDTILDCPACKLHVRGPNLADARRASRKQQSWTAASPCTACGTSGVCYSGRVGHLVCLGCAAKRSIVHCQQVEVIPPTTAIPCPCCGDPIEPSHDGPGHWTLRCDPCSAAADEEAERLADEEEHYMNDRDVGNLPSGSDV